MCPLLFSLFIFRKKRGGWDVAPVQSPVLANAMGIIAGASPLLLNAAGLGGMEMNSESHKI